MTGRWRTGRKVGNTIYRVDPDHPDGRFVASAVTPEDAAALVEAANRGTTNRPTRGEPTMTDPAALLAAALPKDPSHDGPIGVDAQALRKTLAELHTHRLAHHVITNESSVGGGA